MAKNHQVKTQSQPVSQDLLDKQGEKQMITHIDSQELILGIPSNMIGPIVFGVGILTEVLVGGAYLLGFLSQPIPVAGHLILGLTIFAGAGFWLLVKKLK